MASGRELKIRAQKRQQFQDKQQRNRIVAALNNQQQPYVVTDTDTVETIASNNGVDPLDILSANPELKSVQTGMVLNVPPRPGTAEWRDRGGIGLPSNAALGGTTNNPSGFNSINASTGTTSFLNNYNNETPFTPQTLAQNAYRPPTRPPTYPRPATGVAGLAQTVMQNTAQPAMPQTTQPKVINTALPPGYQNNTMMEENYHYNLLRKVNSPTYTPSEADLNYLQHVGLVKKKPPQPAYVSSYSGRGGRRGGGGGGGRPPSTGRAPAPQERLPAFGSGGGFNGLVNWRI